MPSIVYREGRPKPWLVRIKRKGHPIYSKSFRLKDIAERWARKQEDDIDRGTLFDPKVYRDTTVADLAKRYLEQKSPEKQTLETDKYVINAFLKRPLAQKALCLISSSDGATYRDQRQKDTYLRADGREELIKPSSVRREVNILTHIFRIAKTEWGYSDLRNPFDGLRIKNSDVPRTRRLKPGELMTLVNACKQCRGHSKIFAPLAILLAVHTGLRLQEIFNLTWEDVNHHTRRIEVKKSKTGLSRTVVIDLPTWAYVQFGRGFAQDKSPQAKVFPMTKLAFKQTWELIKQKTGLHDLTFHDLRHEAGSRFDELGLTKGEHDLMMGHKNRDMAERYTHSEEKKLAAIQKKFDVYQPNYDEEAMLELAFGIKLS